MPKTIDQLITDAGHILVMQADNPDGDSLASALALEQILGDMGKQVSLYCGVQVPTYLRHLEGWDRVSPDIPNQFDLSIIVDTSADSLFGQLAASGQRPWVAAKPCIVIDHHPVENSIPYATIVHNETAVATGEIIYELARKFDWLRNQTANEMLAVSILADSLGLMTQATTARSIHIIGSLVEEGVNLAELENRRREMMRKSPAIVAYKGRLLQRIQYSEDGRIATIDIPFDEIEAYSNEYNPSVLVLDEMRLTTGVDVAIAFKTYPDGKITGKVRCNYGKAIGNDLASHFGGGGHPYASGFKIQDGRPFNEVKSECIRYATELLDKLEEDTPYETV
ncbi:MAG: hypothetical protein JWM37_358 [Candidatus Saccharibacteria bacterium]|nr:hypothetical protein [Candidatus Saccharibacteria bacterium]